MSQSSAVAIEETQASSDVQQYLTFQLSQEVYGIGILNIKEIIEYGNLTTVPMVPDFIAGVINLRGAVVPVVNLAKRFQVDEAERTKKTSIIIIEIQDEDDHLEIGVVVDLVNEVLDLSTENIAAPPTFGAKIRADFIKGMGKVDGKFMILLDVNHVLSVDELSMLYDEGILNKEDTVNAETTEMD